MNDIYNNNNGIGYGYLISPIITAISESSIIHVDINSFAYINFKANMTQIRPPKTLTKEGKKFWKQLQSEYEICDQGGLAILMIACEAFAASERHRISSRMTVPL